MASMTIIVDGKKTKAASAPTVAALLIALKLNGEEVLVKVNGKLAPNEMKIAASDEVKVMRVIFGG
ncbi:MAG: MoaD/ThiS family protein [Candidatus Micrarchaeota archaeon]|nr:MoaD/ThiS family protein [Candidatus Micrarchaeota archaeon]